MTPRPASQAPDAAAEEQASRPDDQLTIFPVFDPKPRGAYNEKRPSAQLTELPGETWEDIFVCFHDDIDESAGLR